jgi:hypothetical protein
VSEPRSNTVAAAPASAAANPLAAPHRSHLVSFKAPPSWSGQLWIQPPSGSSLVADTVGAPLPFDPPVPVIGPRSPPKV